MSQIETLLALLLATCLIALAAKRLDQPYPLTLLLGGIALAYLPGAPDVLLDPEIVFFVFLPPILAEAAFFTSWRDFWLWKRPIFLLAFGLVAATSATVAAVCVLMISGMTWASGFVLGAIVSPPDAAAATSIVRGMKLPRRIVQILEGESLVNDAAGLVLYQFAVAAVVTRAFSLGNAAVSLLWVVCGGILVGVALAYLMVKVFPHIRDPEVEILSTFLLCYLSYFLAEQTHASGVLATVVSGMILGRHSSRLFSATMRIRAIAVWRMATFVVNGLIFLMIGLQVRRSLDQLAGYPMDRLVLWASVIVLSVIVVRLAWVFGGAFLPRYVSRRIRERESNPGWRGVLIVGWTGLRGVVSLAAALALPVETADGFPFPYRSLILLMTVVVILATLLLQGSTLRPLVKFIGVGNDRSSEQEQLTARIEASERVVDRLVEMEREGKSPSTLVERVRTFYEDRLALLRSQLELETGTEQTEQPDEFQSIAEQRLWYESVRIERQVVVELRDKRRIGDEALHEIERDIDLLEASLVPRSAHNSN